MKGSEDKDKFGTPHEVEDEITKNLDNFLNPTTAQSEILGAAAKKEAKIIKAKMEKNLCGPRRIWKFSKLGKRCISRGTLLP